MELDGQDPRCGCCEPPVAPTPVPVAAPPAAALDEVT